MYYMRDNHTFLPIPLDPDEAEVLLRQEFDNGYTFGMLCSKHEDSPGIFTLAGTPNWNGSLQTQECGLRKRGEGQANDSESAPLMFRFPGASVAVFQSILKSIPEQPIAPPASSRR